MKTNRFLLITIVSAFLLVDFYAQETKIGDIQTPPSPAFVLLGVESNSISNPTTPRAVATSFISAIQQGGAFEVAPYWLKSHPLLTYNDYYSAGVGQTILQTLSISFATIPKTKSTDTLGTRAGLGARWMLVAGQPRDSLNKLQKALEGIMEKMVDPNYADQVFELEKDRKELSLKIQQEDHMRVGFSIAMASAITMNFLEDNFNKGKLDKWGAWLTASYLLEKPSIDFLTVARVIGNKKEEGTQNVFDYGGRIVVLSDDFSLSCEYIQRVELNIEHTQNSLNNKSRNFFDKNTYRLTGNVEYNYNKDISVFLTFGKNYSSENEENGSLVAQVGLNFGFGEIPIINSK